MISSLLSSSVKINNNVLLRQVDDAAVIINLAQPTYFSLNAVGLRMVQVLTESASIEEAYNLLNDEYEVMSETLMADLLELVQELYQHDLIILD